MYLNRFVDRTRGRVAVCLHVQCGAREWPFYRAHRIIGIEYVTLSSGVFLILTWGGSGTAAFRLADSKKPGN